MEILDRLSYTVFLLLMCKVLSVLTQLLGQEHWDFSEDGRLTFPELASKYGHPAETRHVVTDDGYILTVFRIPGDPNRSVLLVHGNSATGDCWIIRGKISLAIVLAGMGYEIWVVNLRGSRYSRRHVTWDPDKDESRFYNYSMYEQAVSDLPATINYMLDVTGQTKITYIGFSAGNSLLYILGAEKPEYNDKIKIGICLAPVCFLDELRIPAFTVANGVVIGSATFTGNYELLNHDQLKPFFKWLCLQPLGYEVCIKRIIFPMFGRDELGFEPAFVSTFFGHYPGGTSRKFLEHQVQVHRRKKFAKFNYNRRRNWAAYGSEDPPEFPLDKITMPIALFWGRADVWTDEVDVIRLNSSLSNVVAYHRLQYEQFNHADFVWGSHMDQTLYPYLLPLIEKYNNNTSNVDSIDE